MGATDPGGFQSVFHGMCIRRAPVSAKHHLISCRRLHRKSSNSMSIATYSFYPTASVVHHPCNLQVLNSFHRKRNNVTQPCELQVLADPKYGQITSVLCREVAKWREAELQLQLQLQTEIRENCRGNHHSMPYH